VQTIGLPASDCFPTKAVDFGQERQGGPATAKPVSDVRGGHASVNAAASAAPQGKGKPMHFRQARAIALAVALIPAGMAAAEGPDADTVLARVNGVEITLGHMIVLYERVPAQVRTRPDAELFDDMLSQLIEQAAVAETAGPPTRAEARFIEILEREHITNNRLSAIAEAALTEEAVAGAYAARFAAAEARREYNAAHILVQTLEEAQALRAQLAEGADFGELARQHSMDPGSGAAGGDLGWFGLGRMVPQFETAVVALEPGAVSDPVETRFGWHIIKLNNIRIAEAPPIEAVRAELERQVQIDAVMASIAEARQAVRIERMDEGIDPALMRDQTLLQR